MLLTHSFNGSNNKSNMYFEYKSLIATAMTKTAAHRNEILNTK